jgi:hypothetical protein
MPRQLIFQLTHRLMLLTTCLFTAAFPATHASAQGGWQRQMVCGDRTDGGCGGSVPVVPRRAPIWNNNTAPPPPPVPREPSAREIREREKQAALDKAQREARDQALRRSWVPVSSSDSVSEPGKIVTIAPDNHLFYTVPSDPIGLIAPVAHAMDGSPVPTEGLRRAVAILMAARAQLQKPDASNEELSFLGQQAALALEGAPLQVEVNEADAPGAAGTAEELRPLFEEMGRQEAVRESSETTKKQALGEYEQLKKQQGSDGTDSPANMQMHHTLAQTYQKASASASAAKEKLGDDGVQIRIIICKAGACPAK